MMCRISRLSKLVKHLETIPDRNFRIDKWWCKSVGCALGHACTMPEFNRLGLTVKLSLFTDTIIPFDSNTECDGYHAAQSFFGLTSSESQFLFSSLYYNVDVSKKVVIDRFKKFIKDKKKGINLV